MKSSTQTDKKIASQNMDQDNFFYRGVDYRQANQGQQKRGRNSPAAAINGQSLNVRQAT
jgi:hypothetical protein